MLLFHFPLVGNKENGNIESRILIGCAPCTMILVFTLLDGWKKLLQTRPYSEVPTKMNLQELRILLLKISNPCLTFLIPFVIIIAEF